MIKTADMLIDEAKARVNCLNIVSAKEMYEQADSKLILDVREPGEAEQAALKDAVNIPRGLIEFKVPGLCKESDRLILLHCAGGGRAVLSALTLQDMGYANAHAITAKFSDIKMVFDSNN